MFFNRRNQPFTEENARSCAIANQLATPGLGSLLAGRWIPGIGQLLLAIIGFILVMAWFFLTLKQAYTLMDSTGEPKSYARLGISGAVVFVASWLWALVTSIQLLQAAKRNREQAAKPPPLTGVSE
jgi:hypothetical protein